MSKLTLRIVRSLFEIPWTEVVLTPGAYIIGRDIRVHIPVTDKYVSRRHARIFYRDGSWYIEDLDSSNGTILNGENIKGKGPVKLNDGDELIIGSTIIRVSIEEG
jgi:pSer/pThr/pTyr-binding forkhead associated (FHA) protein